MFEVQIVDRAFSGRIPPHLWYTVSRPKTANGARRVSLKWRKWFTPQQNAWSGHVRVLQDGRPVVIEEDLTVYHLD